ncbi:hypothetical protein ACHAXR_010559 [Thalassiosira sp. AJA248-18]
MNESFLTAAFLLVINNVKAFSHHSSVAHHHQHNFAITSSTTTLDSLVHTAVHSSSPRTSSPLLHARPKSKWDNLIDEDDDYDDDDEATTNTFSSSINDKVPPDMMYTEVNIRRQANIYDQLEAIGGQDAINDVYVRAPGEKEWWFVGKVARISDVSPEQAIERQWPLIERHVWAIRLPVRPTSNLSTPFEVWYAPGDSELDAARNDPKVQFSKVFSLHDDYDEDREEVKASFVGFVGKVYDELMGEPMFFVERNVMDGSCLRGREIVEGEWVLKSELGDE